MTNAALYDRSRSPLYMQAASQFRLKVQRGIWAPGSQIPVLEDLQAEFALSRATIREALDMLEREGLIERFRGRGTFVRSKLPERQSHRLPTSWDGLLASLRNVEPKLVQPMRREGAGALQGILAGKADGAYVWFQRVHSRADDPYCLIDIRLRADVFDADAERFARTPVILVLADRYCEQIGSAFQRVTFSNADEASASALGIALGAPVVEILRTLVDPEGRVLVHTYARYPGEYVQIDFEFALDGHARTAAGRNVCNA
ncbi:GntR family transcriptional regulator [Mangrovicella endophytica]|uniref:GntR family transcriptional regulator n=1 Tax=Mangrovicella endophytica TaxID=2066697 RepID=UPI000C9DB1EF|nr:GntR family transcriptional regulator [Mangrovicella endophytica]